MRLTFTERTIGKLRSWKSATRSDNGITTTELRELLGISEQVWARLKRVPGSPPIIADRRARVMNPAQVATFLEHWNELETALRLADVARMLHTTPEKVREMVKLGTLEQPFGIVHGHPRWKESTILGHIEKKYGGLLVAPNGKKHKTAKPARAAARP